MATPKSAIERTLRKVRLKKPFKSKDPNFLGRIVPKKTGDNDPNRNHRKVSEDIYRLYNGDEVECDINEMFEITSKLVSKCIDLDEFPMELERLVEMRDELSNILTENSVEALPVRQKMIPQVIDICPHCNAQIQEKEVFYKNSIFHHSACSNPIYYIPEKIDDPNGQFEDFCQNKVNINPEFIDHQIQLLSEFYGAKDGVNAILQTELNGAPAILFLTIDGQLPVGCPQYNYLKVIAEKGTEFKLE